SDSSLLIAMEYFENGDLQRYMTKPFPEKEARQIVVQIVEALDIMHEAGFAHRDLKPANILVFHRGPSWWVKLGDFGISRRIEGITGSMTVGIGSDGYMAPEVLGIPSPDGVDGETDEDGSASVPTIDTWAVGEMTHRMMTNKVSF
ncbi:kinase-like domain-containing protein, partial [Dactylonectria macrodidyma]